MAFEMRRSPSNGRGRSPRERGTSGSSRSMTDTSSRFLSFASRARPMVFSRGSSGRGPAAANRAWIRGGAVGTAVLYGAPLLVGHLFYRRLLYPGAARRDIEPPLDASLL